MRVQPHLPFVHESVKGCSNLRFWNQFVRAADGKIFSAGQPLFELGKVRACFFWPPSFDQGFQYALASPSVCT